MQRRKPDEYVNTRGSQRANTIWCLRQISDVFGKIGPDVADDGELIPIDRVARRHLGAMYRETMLNMFNADKRAADIPVHIRGTFDKDGVHRLWARSLNQRLTPQEEIDLQEAIDGPFPQEPIGAHSASSGSASAPRALARTLRLFP